MESDIQVLKLWYISSYILKLLNATNEATHDLSRIILMELSRLKEGLTILSYQGYWGKILQSQKNISYSTPAM